MSLFSTVIVSNRLPLSVRKVNGKLEYESSSGGLPTAMASLDAANKVWVGWPGIDSDDLTAQDKKAIIREFKKHDCYPVFLTKLQTKLYYEGYANDTIWPLFHYFQSVAHHEKSYWQTYQEVNDLFAETVFRISSKKAKVWIHDYHLMLLPQLIRSSLPHASIGFFLHIPFPSFEIFRMLPERKEILNGLLGADLVGFHIFDYSRHFVSSCKRLLGETTTSDLIDHEGRFVKVAAFPIGIDYAKFRRQLDRAETKKSLASLRRTYKGQQLILSVDRLDYSKGIIERLDAYEAVLKDNPDYIGKIKLMMIAVPSRTDVEAYKQLRDEIEMKVSRINGTYGTVEWAPISYQFQNRPFAEVVALYQRADIALVTPIRDGMNLVAKEFIASKKSNTGVLILSEMAGAVDELPEAVTVNPYDTQSIKTAIEAALVMTKYEQAKRIKIMQGRLEASTVQKWGTEFMDSLATTTGIQNRNNSKKLLPPQARRIATQYQLAKKRLILFDYDGTLRSFVKTPNPLAAAPTLKARRILKALTDDPDNTVAIISGRPRSALTGWFPGTKMKLAAEHGAWTRFENKWVEADSDFGSIRSKIITIMKKYESRTHKAAVEQKDYSIVWHYKNVEPDLAFKRTRELISELRSELAEHDVSIDEGHDIVEVKPTSISKGQVVKELLELYPADFVLCAGDDLTDESMFAVLDDEQSITIKIGNGETKAKYQIESVQQHLNFLTLLVPDADISLRDITNRFSFNKPKKIVRKFLEK